VGKPARIVEPGHEQRFSYDEAGRLTAHTRRFGERDYTTRYEYDPATGQTLAKTLPDGQRLAYRYHDAGHPQAGALAEVLRPGWWGKRRVVVTDLNPADEALLRRTMTLADGSQDRVEFDTAGRLLHAGSDAYGVDDRYAAGARLPMGLTRPGGITLGLSYEEAGRRLGRGGEAASPALQGFLAATQADAASAPAFARNADGAVTDTPTRHYEVNNQGQLTAVFAKSKSSSGQQSLIARYRYNAFGQRIVKTVYAGSGKTVTYFLYDGAQLSAEIDGASGTVIAHYVYVGGRPIARLAGRQIQAVHSDALGAPRAVTSEDGELLWQAPGVGQTPARSAAAPLELHLRAAGQYADPETGLIYTGRRYFDPAAGRFLSADPQADAATPQGVAAPAPTPAPADALASLVRPQDDTGSPGAAAVWQQLSLGAPNVSAAVSAAAAPSGQAQYTIAAMLDAQAQRVGSGAMCSIPGAGWVEAPPRPIPVPTPVPGVRIPPWIRPLPVPIQIVIGILLPSEIGAHPCEIPGSPNYGNCAGGGEPDDNQRKRCQALKDSILNTCRGLKGAKMFRCFKAADTAYRQCMGFE